MSFNDLLNLGIGEFLTLSFLELELMNDSEEERARV